MVTKTKSKPKFKPSTPAILPLESSTELPRTPPSTTEEYVLYIRILANRIEGHVDFMCGANKLGSTSIEAKIRSLGHFYNRLSTLEQDLGRIKEDLQLG
jgi:hypothetical protein